VRPTETLMFTSLMTCVGPDCVSVAAVIDNVGLLACHRYSCGFRTARHILSYSFAWAAWSLLDQTSDLARYCQIGDRGGDVPLR